MRVANRDSDAESFLVGNVLCNVSWRAVVSQKSGEAPGKLSWLDTLHMSKQFQK